MTLGSAAAAISGLWSGAKHVVAGANRTRPTRLAGMVPRRRCSNGASGCGSRQEDMVARVKCARGPFLPPRIISRQTVHCSSLVVAPTEWGLSGPQCLLTGAPIGTVMSRLHRALALLLRAWDTTEVGERTGCQARSRCTAGIASGEIS